MFGVCTVAWGVDVIPRYQMDAPLRDIAERILAGEKFNAAQLSAIRRQLDASPVRLIEASALGNAAVIQQLLLEDETMANNREPSASDLAGLDRVVSATLSQSPTNSFVWLMDF